MSTSRWKIPRPARTAARSTAPRGRPGGRRRSAGRGHVPGQLQQGGPAMSASSDRAAGRAARMAGPTRPPGWRPISVMAPTNTMPATGPGGAEVTQVVGDDQPAVGPAHQHGGLADKIEDGGHVGGLHLGRAVAAGRAVGDRTVAAKVDGKRSQTVGPDALSPAARPAGRPPVDQHHGWRVPGPDTWQASSSSRRQARHPYIVVNVQGAATSSRLDTVRTPQRSAERPARRPRSWPSRRGRRRRPTGPRPSP